MFPCSSNGKESACNAGVQGLIPGLGISSGEGNGNPLQYSCLENSMDSLLIQRHGFGPFLPPSGKFIGILPAVLDLLQTSILY